MFGTWLRLRKRHQGIKIADMHENACTVDLIDGLYNIHVMMLCFEWNLYDVIIQIILNDRDCTCCLSWNPLTDYKRESTWC